MDEELFIRLLDVSDEYVRANEALIVALRKGFFALAQARYATGYRKVRVDCDDYQASSQCDRLVNAKGLF